MTAPEPRHRSSARRSPSGALTLRQARGERPHPVRSGRAAPVAAAPLRIRLAAASDAAACAAIMRAAIRGLPSGVHPPRVLAAWASLPLLYHRWAMGPGGELYLVAERAGRLLGYAALRNDELTAVFVRPRAQGAGVGRALVRAAALRARRAGARRLRVLAARAAVAFYAALGYRGTVPAQVPLPGGLTLDAVRMRMRLAPELPS